MSDNASSNLEETFGDGGGGELQFWWRVFWIWMSMAVLCCCCCCRPKAGNPNPLIRRGIGNGSEFEDEEAEKERRELIDRVLIKRKVVAACDVDATTKAATTPGGPKQDHDLMEKGHGASSDSKPAPAAAAASASDPDPNQQSLSSSSSLSGFLDSASLMAAAAAAAALRLSPTSPADDWNNNSGRRRMVAFSDPIVGSNSSADQLSIPYAYGRSHVSDPTGTVSAAEEYASENNGEVVAVARTQSSPETISTPTLARVGVTASMTDSELDDGSAGDDEEEAEEEKIHHAIDIHNRDSIRSTASQTSAVSGPAVPRTSTYKGNIVARTLARVGLGGMTTSTYAQDGMTSSALACDICLTEYEVGDEVAWSPNDACPHAFHVECITDWLMRNPTCPLCRNDYCHVSAAAEPSIEKPQQEQQQQQQHETSEEFEDESERPVDEDELDRSNTTTSTHELDVEQGGYTDISDVASSNNVAEVIVNSV